ncbi:FAD:protein FMN transferase [Sedimentitalea sp. HM32M-2]|uniref:FAD:protein FMN transferase n=1 Tax=Sedimentitalea sp. HM32M-2 TaxID=3351566 RepID=UPI00362961E8
MTDLTRRRFLTVTAATLATPAAAAPVRWQGHALGAEIGLTLHAPADLAEAAIRHTRDRLREIERLFSLYDPKSVLSQLNRTGQLDRPPEGFRTLIDLCAVMHAATGGVFDPTIQSLWQARPDPAAIGWDRVRTGTGIDLAPGQQITLNGIAQGFATDLIRADLARLGLRRALVNIGEFAAVGGPFTLGLADPKQGLFATRTLTGLAIATSSPGAMTLKGGAHIRHPARNTAPLWSTVSVVARSAAVADAASTAFAVMTRAELRRALARMPRGTQVTLLSEKGDIERF